jgi:hypothetical protein
MARSLGGRAWRVRKLEGLDRSRERPPLSRREREAHGLDVEIREIEDELRALEVDPGEWRYTSGRADLSLEEHIAAIEKELDDGDDH